MRDGGCVTVRSTVGLPGWSGVFVTGERPAGVHPTAEIGGPPEHPAWLVGMEILPPDIHPAALINSFCTVDGGMPGYPTTRIGERAFLQSKAHIGHNAIVEAHARVCAGSVICGHARVGAGASVSGNSWVKPWVTIGEGAIIGGGSVVTKDVPAHEVWAGNPARFMKLAWTHPEHVSEREPHPFEDPDEMWQMMRPWHHRGAPA